jgi:hypothetical protein
VYFISFPALTVERLYCKRPIQCLASSKILTPHPLTARRVCTPPTSMWGEDTHSLHGEGGGGSIFWKTLLCTLHMSTLALCGLTNGKKGGLEVVAFDRSPFKVTVSRDFLLLVFHESVSPKPLIIPLGPFRIFRKFAEIFAAQGLPPVSWTRVAKFLLDTFR